MIFKSIKWRCNSGTDSSWWPCWLDLGVTAYQLERNRVFRRVDDETHRRMTFWPNSFAGRHAVR